VKYELKTVDGIEVCFSSDWIYEIETEGHFNFYYQQAKVVYDYCNRSDKILEIGVGSGLLSDLLKRRGWKVTTLDIDVEKSPDICESASDFDYLDASVDVVLAFEIFEHIPFSTFDKVIEKISASEVKGIYFSLPWNEVQLISFKLKLPIIDAWDFRLAIPRNKITTRAHFWELSKNKKEVDGKLLLTIETVRQLFEKYGYAINKLGKTGYIEYFQATKLK